MTASLYQRVPEILRNRLGTKSKVIILSGKEVFSALKDETCIIMACNVRIAHALPGIMRAAQELDAVIAFELTRTEGGLDGGYTGQNPAEFVDTIIACAEAHAFTKPIIIHADHITVRDTSDAELSAARDLIGAQLEAGFTSFAIDASFNSLTDNIRIVSELAPPILEKGYGLELELGERPATGGKSSLTSVSEATSFLRANAELGIKPQLLAINNGSKRGNYLEGEIVHIDLEKTHKIFRAALPFGLVGLVQHGITGTPLHLVGKLADYGIRKANIGTLWQNVVHAGLPLDLMDQMKDWARESGLDIKFATKVFKSEIESIPETNIRMIHDLAYREAREFLTAFRASGTASKLLHHLEAQT